MAIIDLNETQEELRWLDKKLALKADKLQGQPLIAVRRGEVYWCEFGYNMGSEMRGKHPCVVVQGDSSSKNLRTAIVAPITHAANRNRNTASLVPLTSIADSAGKSILEGYVDTANIRSVSKARLVKLITRLNDSDMRNIDSALASCMGLYHYYKDGLNNLEKARTRGDLKEAKARELRKSIEAAQQAIEAGNIDKAQSILADALNL